MSLKQELICNTHMKSNEKIAAYISGSNIPNRKKKYSYNC
jgi:hypothetical protein